jgi:hypothetical protein
MAKGKARKYEQYLSITASPKLGEKCQEKARQGKKRKGKN